jgi:hypothetical protein
MLEASIFRKRLLNVGRQPALQRVAHLLCEQLARREAVGLNSATIPLTQMDLADAAGLYGSPAWPISTATISTCRNCLHTGMSRQKAPHRQPDDRCHVPSAHLCNKVLFNERNQRPTADRRVLVPTTVWRGTRNAILVRCFRHLSRHRQRRTIVTSPMQVRAPQCAQLASFAEARWLS